MSKTLQMMEWTAIGLAVVTTIVSLVVWTPDAAAAVAVGGLISVGNFYTLRVLSGAMMDADRPTAGRALLAGLAGVKLFVLLGVLAAAIVWLDLHRIGLVVGLSAMVISIPVGAALSASVRTPEASNI